VGIARRPDETDAEYHARHLAYHRAWKAKKTAANRKSEPAEQDGYIVIPERVLKERDAALQTGYRSQFSELLGEPLIRRSALCRSSNRPNVSVWTPHQT